MKRILKAIFSPHYASGVIFNRIVKRFIKNDYTFVKWDYYFGMKKFPNLDNPRTFNEKLQWLKLHNQRPEYTRMVDKYEAKECVKEILGEEYIIPTLGVWERFEDIDFNNLPNQFVLKCTHDSGGLVICKDKSKLDISKVRRKINRSLKKNFFYEHREYPYKDVKPRIIAEKYMIDDSSTDLKDYKFFCFNGKVQCLKVDFDRFTKHGANYYDKEWNLLPFYEICCPSNPLKIIGKPKYLNKMVEVAEKISKGIPFVRVDLYDVNNKIYFGEITFFPNAGNGKFEPEEWDYKLGEWLQLPK